MMKGDENHIVTRAPLTLASPLGRVGFETRGTRFSGLDSIKHHLCAQAWAQMFSRQWSREGKWRPGHNMIFSSHSIVIRGLTCLNPGINTPFAPGRYATASRYCGVDV
ncbi:hypothetical protein AVEN_41751-1 [Araneus ventricosus]|uniref:Uncharacterized protein n=1 Tax=Araneus ventricosus TaxID=182803 RepID=A0A4Y2ADD4_ARAVE|nr:hypothetical protein AVEN_41751-1 [Araneus ventricosus]